ncbi:FMN reductase [Arthrobacter pascens]|uniref:CE1759 family FMN reductase n=1 Tax=Arthrobacter pascens TaxID=1677 RepID=UPI0027915D98|nr:CE1759 family FMN reductase [Arthrobacter pascens]MDQ0678724.1 FMN reductase [Arthrobacter pascens]
MESGEFKLVVLAAGVSTPSSSRLLADLLAEAAVVGLATSGIPVEPVVIELRDLFADIAAAYSGAVTSRLREAFDRVSAADALVVVSPVFASSYSGMFKAFLDLLDPTAIVDTPTIIGATGGSLRHSLVLEHAMRPLFSYLRAVVVPTSIFATAMDWAAEETTHALRERAQRAAQELTQTVRSSGVPLLMSPPYGQQQAA